MADRQWLWTWGGRCFGYRAGDSLYRYDGRYIGRFHGDEVYGVDGRYLGETKKTKRLITHKSKKNRIKGAARRGNRGGFAPYANYAGYAMYAGYEDFPAPEEFG
jgi:hypothetical protein